MLCALCVFIPEKATVLIGKFPRGKFVGMLLAMVCVVWAAWLINEANLGNYEHLKKWLWVVTPVVYILVVIFMDDLLAARALGGIMLLVPAPLLESVREHESHMSLIVAVVAYLIVVEGMILVMAPYHFRKVLKSVIADTKKCRIAGMAGLSSGVFLIFLGVVFL